MTAPEPITVVILSRNRPLYLWACLDSLYRYTRHPARFVLTDNASDDPMVRDVVRGFERRGMFHAVEWHDENDPQRILKTVRDYVNGPADKVVAIESDVTVFDTDPCWLGRMNALMDDHPELGLLGSYVDKRDFIPVEDTEALVPDLPPNQAVMMIKTRSPERTLPDTPPDEALIDPFNPPGRLIMARKSMMSKIVYALDTRMYKHAKEAGIGCAIAPSVRHRHLSLLNAYDYPEFDVKKRREHFVNNRDPVYVLPDTSNDD
ncbi:glycosyltransferase family 2 protein [Shimia haliotis]|uniref:Glycosyltransferase, GT2 family n=1 Tax=Shimia haliotis TaxID=1280847 RepID=A0A1I4FK89_9RHOB|nr:glycosyltransferase family A protein [Shimia haliotis]SFL16871.1 Glycosyltransferase, GT2 family [Shimia haliotis]